MSVVNTEDTPAEHLVAASADRSSGSVWKQDVGRMTQRKQEFMP